MKSFLSRAFTGLSLICIAVVLVFAGFLAVSLAHAAPLAAHAAIQLPSLDEILAIMLKFGSYAGIATLIAVALNVLKFFELIPDGKAGSILAALQLVAMLALVAARALLPALDPSTLDAGAGTLAAILMFVLSYLVAIKTGGTAAATLTKMEVPVFGASYSADTTKSSL